MSERSLSVSPVIEPFAGGVIGLGIGYTIAPRKYSLKRLMLLKQDRFDKIYTKELAENLSQKEKAALDTIKAARKEYRATRTDVMNRVKETAKKWQEKFTKVEISSENLKNYNTNKQNLKKAIEETNYVELNKAYREAKAAYLKSPADEGLKVALNEANSNLAITRAILTDKIELYKDSVKNITNERLMKVKSNPGKYANVREAYHEFLSALANRRTAASHKLFELTNDNQIKKSYEAIKEFLPKSRTKSAAAGAIIVGTITAALMSHINRSANKIA